MVDFNPFKKFFNSPKPKESQKEEATSSVVENRFDKKILEAKLAEYKARMDHYKPPEYQFDTVYKIEILKEFLAKGMIDIADLAKRLKEKYGTLDMPLFQNACLVIQDYVLTGGKKHVRGGTGLPQKGESK